MMKDEVSPAFLIHSQGSGVSSTAPLFMEKYC